MTSHDIWFPQRVKPFEFIDFRETLQEGAIPVSPDFLVQNIRLHWIFSIGGFLATVVVLTGAPDREEARAFGDTASPSRSNAQPTNKESQACS